MRRRSGTLLILISLAALWLLGCHGGANKNTTVKTATVTLKVDGTQFSGTVVSSDANSITIINSENEARTFLYSEVSKVAYGSPATSPGSTGGVAKSQTATGSEVKQVSMPSPAGGVIQFPAGVEIPVRNNGVLDACCLYDDAISLGNVDSDVKSSDGRVVIPEGANVTILTRHHEMRDGRVTLVFELGSADFGGHHYVIEAASGKQDEGAMATFSGAQEGSPEARVRGVYLHLDDRSYMGFKTAGPTVFKLADQ